MFIIMKTYQQQLFNAQLFVLNIGLISSQYIIRIPTVVVISTWLISTFILRKEIKNQNFFTFSTLSIQTT